MNSDAVIGCESIHPEPEALRLIPAGGEARIIAWNSIRLAGMGAKFDRHVLRQGVTEIVGPYLATHNSLFIVYGEGSFAEVMIEKTSPQCGAILAAFSKHLGDRWRGDDLKESELTGATLIPPTVRFPKASLVTAIAAGIAFFLVMAILFFTHGAKPTAP
jgi:hypothetical protein